MIFGGKEDWWSGCIKWSICYKHTTFVTFKCIIFLYTTVIGLYVLDLGLKLDLLYNRMPNIIWLPLRDPIYVTVQILPFEKLTAIYMESLIQHRLQGGCEFYFFLFFIYLFIYLFIFGCAGSSFLCEGFLQLWRARAPHCRGLSRCGAQAPDAQAQ